MEKIIKFFLTLSLSAILFFSAYSVTFAQYFTCSWDSVHGDCIIGSNYCTNGCTVPNPACAGMDPAACSQLQACDCGQGNYRCEKPAGFPLCSLVNDCVSGCYEPPGACTAGCANDSPWMTCVCRAGFECENAPVPGRCVPDDSVCVPSWWIQSDCIPEEKCVREAANCVEPSTTPTPTPGGSGDPACDALCPNPNYPDYTIPQCGDAHSTPNCAHASDDQYDCTIGGDCMCCARPTPRLEMSPLCQGQDSINTAFGCIPVGDENLFLAWVLRWAIGIAGGVSFILIVYSGFMIMTSGGDKRKLQVGKELLTAALSGLILIIFSVFILDIIGVRILRIPGLV